MYERFTDKAQRIMTHLACDEAHALRHGYVGTEHLLIALADENSSIAVTILRSFGLDQRQIRAEVERLIPPSDKESRHRKLPLSSACKKAVEFAIHEAILLDRNYIGTEHLLMGVARKNAGTGAQVLSNLGADVDEVHSRALNFVIRLYGGFLAESSGE